MSDITPPPVASMPAWWDPKDRKILFNPGSIVPGVLFVSESSISFVTREETVFDCPLNERVPTLKGFFQAATCAFRLTCNDITYRLYLCPPQGAPKLSRDHLNGVVQTLQATSYGGNLIGGTVAGFTGVLGFVGDAVGTVSATADLVRARRNYKLIQERIASYGRDHAQP
ncbi:MAG TPA: hypothetical protein VEH31_39345 [Streptosporangiaceae bacterium]|nr:hypothetical protein [Streptosporangiaceae bacterium]